MTQNLHLTWPQLRFSSAHRNYILIYDVASATRIARCQAVAKNGVLKASDAQDHKPMMEALERIDPIPSGWPKNEATTKDF